MKKRISLNSGALVVIFILGAGLLTGLLMFGLALASEPLAHLGDQFMSALRDGDDEQAYALLTNAYRDTFGSLEAFAENIDQRGIHPRSWQFESRSVTGQEGIIFSEIILDGDVEDTMTIYLEQTGIGWRISAFHLGIGSQR